MSKNTFSVQGLEDLCETEQLVVNGGVNGTVTVTGPLGGSASLTISGSDGSGTITGTVTGPKGQSRSGTLSYTIT